MKYLHNKEINLIAIVQINNEDRYGVKLSEMFSELSELCQVHRIDNNSITKRSLLYLENSIYKIVGSQKTNSLIKLVKKELRKISVVIIPGSTSSQFKEIYEISKNVPVISIQHLHAFLTYWHDPNDLKKFPADHICVWGEITERYLRNHGVSSKISITGSTYLNEPFLKKMANTPNSNKNILFISQFISKAITEDIKLRSMRDMVSILEKFNDIKIIIKLHPNEDGDFEKTYLANNKMNSRFEIVQGDLEEWLEKSFCAMTIYSNGALDAMLKDIPVIMLNYEGLSDKYTCYIKNESVLATDKLETLLNEFGNLLNNESFLTNQIDKQRRFLGKFIQHYDEKSCEYIYKVIESY
jgi:hypothetical protein